MRMNKIIIFLSVLSLSFLSFPFPSLAEKYNPDDKKALLKIMEQLVLTSWDPKTDCCDWYGVECDLKTHRIVQPQFFASLWLTGQIPKAISELPYLEFLMFHKLSLTANIPQSITKLKHLTFLDLSWNHLSRPVSEFLTQLKKLYYLNLSFNNFTGSIPPSLSKFRNLLALHLDRNNLTGIIPDSFGQFTGVISFLFGTNKTVQILDFLRNMLQFDLSEVEFPENLTSLDLNHNSITGSLPQGLVNLTLYGFNVSYNRLCREIPSGGKLQTFNYTAYFHNKCLCGSPLAECK